MRKRTWALATVLAWCVILQSSFAAEPTGRYKAIVDQLNKLHVQYPNITSIYSIGKNDDGVDILAMRVSLTPAANDPKKIGQLIVGTHHGNEFQAPVFTMAFLTDLLGRYHTSNVYRGNLADMEWHVVPVLNISGYNQNNRYEKGVDPNRDYPGPCVATTTSKLASIRLAQALLASRPFAGSLTVHGYIGALTYPWGIDIGDTHTLDHNQFEAVTAKAARENGYQHGTSTDIVYPCDGSFEDYSYWKHGTWSLLAELRDGSPTDIKNTIKAITVYFDGIDSSPSVKNQLKSQCKREKRPDLQLD